MFLVHCCKFVIRAQKIRTTTLTKNALKSNLPKEYYVHKVTESIAENEELKKRIKALESQLAATQKSSNNNNNSNENTLEMLQEAELWKKQIDELFDEVKTAQDNFFAMTSKEKLLKFRSKLKENNEQNRKIFYIDAENLVRVSKQK